MPQGGYGGGTAQTPTGQSPTGGTVVSGALPAIANALPVLDPSYLAFMRELGASEADAQAEAASAIARLRGRISDLRPAYDERLKRGMQGIGEDFENRGLLRSGRRLEDQTNFQADTEGDYLAQKNAIGDQIGGIQTDLARQIAGGRRARAEAEAAARDRVARENASLGM